MEGVVSKPQPPERASAVDVGLSAITRRLQGLASAEHTSSVSSSTSHRDTYSLIFVARSGQSSAFNGHFPQMVAVASHATPDTAPIRLVGYSKSCADRLSASLGIPRVSSIGIRREAPGSDALVSYVQRCVAPVVVPWLAEAGKAEFRASHVKSEEKMVAAVAKTVKN